MLKCNDILLTGCDVAFAGSDSEIIAQMVMHAKGSHGLTISGGEVVAFLHPTVPTPPTPMVAKPIVDEAKSQIEEEVKKPAKATKTKYVTKQKLVYKAKKD